MENITVEKNEKSQANIVISKSLLKKGRELAAEREMTFSCLVRELIKKELKIL